MSNFTLNATARDLQGKGASRRLRHANKVPAVVYGAGKDAANISVEFKDLVKLLESTEFYTSPVSLSIDGAVETVQLKALQRHPAKNVPMHADFVRVGA